MLEFKPAWRGTSTRPNCLEQCLLAEAMVNTFSTKLVKDKLSTVAYLHIIDYLGQAAKFVPGARLDVDLSITGLCGGGRERKQLWYISNLTMLSLLVVLFVAVTRITQKLKNRFPGNVPEWWGLTQERTYYILEQIWINGQVQERPPLPTLS